MTLKPPITYLGAKTRIAPKVVNLLPVHTHYIEPFAGSLAVLLAKEPSTAETVSDIDGDLMAFWEVLRDQPDELTRACALTPHSRGEYYRSLEPLNDLPPVERARRVWVRINQGSSRTLKHGGMWARYVTYQHRSRTLPTQLHALADRITPVAERLSQVSLDNRPALDMIRKYGRSTTNLLYLDPPYLETTTKNTQYAHQMSSTKEHEEILEAALSCNASVAISGYPSDLYEQALSGWSRYTIPTRTRSKGVTEVLWINTPAEPRGR